MPLQLLSEEGDERGRDLEQRCYEYKCQPRCTDNTAHVILKGLCEAVPFLTNYGGAVNSRRGTKLLHVLAFPGGICAVR